MLVMNVYD